MNWAAPFESNLAALADAGSLRRLSPRRGVDFSSNDYLGLADAPLLREAAGEALARGVPIGSCGSRLLRGNDPEIEALEAEAAAFFGDEATLFFSSGFAANTAFFATVPQRGDLVVHDALIHASVHDGMRLGRAETRAAAHQDVAAFDAVIADWRGQGGTGRVWIAVESLYSMDGDKTPLANFAALADRHEAMLVVDEAHATGVWGPLGRGLSAELPRADNRVILRTLGKALGCEGALLGMPRLLADFMVNRARPFIFSTAPSPLMAAIARAAIRSLEASERREQLHALVDHAAAKLAPIGVPATGSQILLRHVGGNARAVAMAEALQAQGFDVRAIRPPTVPQGTARLRISLTLNATPDDVDALAQGLGDLA
ncbi:8-amino-7-oxononanoate synthase [Stakelama tenebrarum]|uniref:8-amino-7-oxononanoate synthase n=1 Tax=Stakelama tenebrarum TaxID=2711215 RepID=A0A6G6Y774_9SPHN|nr:8-amino-7-oxononanoate synthase [Sphingosinithalassobacter tenebrarum]QIG80701.1 8-amino-7-oxononanoate synthase [Sphingosinithalassobacter tenebrarum]